MTEVEFYYSDIWSKVKLLLKDNKSIPAPVYTTYFDDTSLVFLNGEKAIIRVTYDLQKMVLLQKIDAIKEAMLELGYVISDCDIQLANSQQEKQSAGLDHSFRDKMLADYTFDNFIVGPSNKEAHSAALACAFNPGRFYTPLFIYGNSGLGKTHLLNAIGNYIKDNDPSKKVYYTASVDFVTAVADSTKDGSIEAFKTALKRVDVLLVDDIQFIAGKEKSHEIFFTVFNELVNNKKQIILTSDRDPAEIKGLEERLISRFSSGLTVGLDSPEFETSLAILKYRLENQSYDLTMIDDDVLSYIATNFSKDVRKLEGALNRLLFYSIQFGNNQRIDFRVALGAFKNSGSSAEKNEISVNKIKRIVSDYYGLTKQQLTSNSRTKNIANARHIAMYLSRKMLDLSFLKIGEEFGKRDHSTVISACEKVETLSKKDIQYKNLLNELEKQIIQT